MSPDESVKLLKSVGDKKANLLEKLGIKTIRDLLYYVPRAYETPGQLAATSDLRPGGVYSVNAVIDKAPNLRRIRKGFSLTTFSLSDEAGNVEAVFFNQPYLSRMYHKGDKVFVSGATKIVGRRLQFTNPHMEKGHNFETGLNPVYPLTAGLTQKAMRILMKAAVETCASSVKETLPEDFRKVYGLAEITYSLKNIHLPKDEESIEAAKKRLVFEELLLFNLALLQRENTEKGEAVSLKSDERTRKVFISLLDYTPTNAQLRVMREIEEDLSKQQPMNRLMQGDVGSGKTTPAFYAMYICAKNARQSVMMVPTEVLAKQHFKNACSLFMGTGINVELLTGSTPAAERRLISQNIAGGNTDIVIGTHAVLYDNIQFSNLGLIITDEQHRFGVNQRAKLESKTNAPHTLIMSATPIPRSLALIIFGRTDISVIDEMPPGRQPVKTFVVSEHKRSDMYGFLEKEITSGSQVFVVCPLIEQSEALDAKSSEEVYYELKNRFGEQNTTLLHGRMKPDEKNETMERFKNKKFSILVSTTVIEVGVDVPNATIMIIENAERFGLAQLHQLRGRVGRGEKRSYCFLMCENNDNERLSILTKTNDGFKISEEDLKLRGPGQFLGSQQSGSSDLYMANMMGDMKLLKQTRDVALKLEAHSGALYKELLKQATERFSFDNITIN